MKKKQKIVMLPTDDISHLGAPIFEKELEYDKEGFDPHIVQTYHLYILSDDEVKESDWCVFNNEIIKTKHSFMSGGEKCWDTSTIVYGDSLLKKIIATTNLSLTKIVDDKEKKIIQISQLPQTPQSLVEYYAKHQPEEVELEYEEKFFTEEDGFNNTKSVRLKLQNNEVVWVKPKLSEIKPKIVSDEEIEANSIPAYRRIKSKEFPKHKLYTHEEVEKIAWEISTYFENIDENDFKKGFDYVMKKLY